MINLNLVPLLQWILEGHHRGGKIMTLGRQTVGFDRFGAEKLVASGELPVAALDGWQSNQETILGHLGFDTVHSLDVSDFEDCTHLHDLNLPDPPAELVGQYDVVLTGGSLEHVFDVGNGIRTTLAMIKPYGLLIHMGPMNNWVDHGFYQFSPTLWFDLAADNGMSVLQSAVCDFIETPKGGGYFLHQVAPGEGSHLAAKDVKRVHVFVARRVKTVPFQVPKQSLYLKMHENRQRQFELHSMQPFTVIEGVRRPVISREVELLPDKMQQIGEGSWSITYQEEDAPGGTDQRPFLSRAVVCEDGIPLPFRVADSASVIASPPGRFAHRLNEISFSSRDGSDPRRNRRKYTVSL